MQLHAPRMITIIVNGETAETGAATLADLIAELGYDGARVATALNGDFVLRGDRAGRKLAPDDRIEIVAPRQGG